MANELEGGFKSPEEREAARQFKGKVMDVDLARDIAKAEAPGRQRAQDIREGGELSPELAEMVARRHERAAVQMGEDVEKGPEGIEREADSVIEKISRLSGLHYVFLAESSPGTVTKIKEKLGVDVGTYTHIVDSFHIYHPDTKDVEKVLATIKEGNGSNV